MVIQALDLGVSLNILNERVPCDDLCLSMILHSIDDRIKTVDFCISAYFFHVAVIQDMLTVADLLYRLICPQVFLLPVFQCSD